MAEMTVTRDEDNEPLEVTDMFVASCDNDVIAIVGTVHHLCEDRVILHLDREALQLMLQTLDNGNVVPIR